MYCAHSTGHFNSNGYSTRTAGLVAGLGASGEDVVVVARPGYPWDSATDVSAPGQKRLERDIAGVAHIFNPGPDLSADRLDHYLMDAADVYVREAQRNRVAVIHAASNYVTALPALLAARRLGLPFVYEVRGIWEITELSDKPWWAQSDRYRLAVTLETLVVEQADQVLAITDQVRDELVRRGAPKQTSPPAELCRPGQVQAHAALSVPCATSCGLHGRIDCDRATPEVWLPTKASAISWPPQKPCWPGARRAAGVVGDGKQLPELKKIGQELGIDERVTFTGRVPAKAVADYMSLFDIMPCPRRRFPVTEMVSPLKPLEAMASGKAVVLSDLGPSRDLAGKVSSGRLLCHPGNPDSLADSAAPAGRRPRTSHGDGRRARLWTLEQRTWTLTAQIAAAAHRAVQADSAADAAQDSRPRRSASSPTSSLSRAFSPKRTSSSSA